MNDKFASTCVGQTLQPPLPPVSPQPDLGNAGIIAGSLTGAAVLLLCCCMGVFICIRKRRKNSNVPTPAQAPIFDDKFQSRTSPGAISHAEAAFKSLMFAITIVHFLTISIFSILAHEKVHNVKFFVRSVLAKVVFHPFSPEK